MTVTIRQVAKAAKTSPATVSRVLNNSAGVSPDVRQNVLEAVELLRYQPNRMARALVTNRTAMLGLIVADVANPFFPELIKGTEHAASEHDYNVLLCNTEESPEQERHLLEFLQRQVDCIILAGSRLPEAELAPIIASLSVPVVLINRCLEGTDVPAVYTDGKLAMEQAVQHLTGQGHTRIAYVCGPQSSWSNRERQIGFETAMSARKLEQIYIQSEQPTIEAGASVAEMLLKDTTLKPTALITYNDLIAIGIIRTLLRAGILIPNQMAIIGVDNISLAGLIEPPLTSLEQSKYALGETAVQMAMAKINHRPLPERCVALEARLIIRRSSLTKPNANDGS